MPGPTTSEQLVHDRYVLYETIGRGRMGTVRRARDTLVGREVAVKEIELPAMLDVGEQAALKGKIIREARAAVGFIHPGALRIYDVFDHDGKPVIVSELSQGRTLQQLVERDGPITPERAAAIGLDVLDVLVAAHQQGFVHRHVAPSNIMISSFGPARVSDFGITPYLSDPKLAALGFIGGSPHYFAPEQVSSRGSSEASDLWALGATLYFAVEGRTPFPLAADPADVLEAIAGQQPRPQRRTGRLHPVIDSLLVKEPELRPDPATLRAQLHEAARKPGPDGETLATAADEPASMDPVLAISRMFSPDPHAPEAWQPLDLSRGAGLKPGDPLPPPWPIPHRRLRKTATIMSVLVILVLVGLLVTNGQLGRESDERAARQTPVVVTVPQSWGTYNDPATAFVLSHPPDWSVVKFGPAVRFEDPTGEAYVQGSYSPLVTPSPAAAVAGLEERQFPGNASGYNRLRITPTKFANSEAAIWEYTFDAGGVRQHQIDIVFNTTRVGFTLSFRSPDKEWPDFRPIFAGFTSSFSIPL